MKIRIKGNSLRFRLTRSEVEKFCCGGEVKDEISFSASSLQYRVVTTQTDHLSASFDNNCITVWVPAALSAGWNTSDLVGFDGAINIPGTNDQLTLLVEKDFICMDKAVEDQSDNYPNPLNIALHEQQ